MSDNRFSDCETPEGVIARAARIGGDIAAGANPVMLTGVDYFDALARIAELTPRTVDEAGRERAVPVVMAAMREAQERGTDIPSGNRWLDRIIDALGWTAAADELTAQERAGGATECPQHDYCDTDCWARQLTAPVPPTPVVELDWHVDFAPDELLTLAKVVDDFERLYHDVAQVVAPDTMRTTLDLDIIDGDLPVRVVCSDAGCWVLRIGGGDE